MSSNAPFDDIRDLIRALPDGNDEAGSRARDMCRRDVSFGGAGLLEDMAVWLATASGKAPPQLNKPMIAVFAGAHGVARHGISSDTAEAAGQYVQAVAAGQGLLSRLCAEGNVGLKVLDLALDLPTGDITQEAALDERACAATMAFGMEAVAGGHDVLCLSGIGAGGKTSAAALLAGLFHDKADGWANMSQGEHIRLREIGAIDAALTLHGEALNDPLQMLRRLGGREIAAMAGAIIAARMERVPVVLDGLAAFAAAAVVHHVRPGSVTHCAAAAALVSTRAAHAARVIGLDCVGLTDGDPAPGIDSALAVGVLRSAAHVCA